MSGPEDDNDNDTQTEKVSKENNDQVGEGSGGSSKLNVDLVSPSEQVALRAIFSMDKVDVEVYIFSPFFEIDDRMCIGILFRSEGISRKTGCGVIQHGQTDMGILRHG